MGVEYQSLIFFAILSTPGSGFFHFATHAQVMLSAFTVSPTYKSRRTDSLRACVRQGLSLSARVETVSRPESVSRSDDLGGKKVDLPDMNSKRDKEKEEEEERVFFCINKRTIWARKKTINRFQTCARLNGPDGQHAVYVLCFMKKFVNYFLCK